MISPQKELKSKLEQTLIEVPTLKNYNNINVQLIYNVEKSKKSHTHTYTYREREREIEFI